MSADASAGSAPGHGELAVPSRLPALTEEDEDWARDHFDATDVERMQDPFSLYRFLRDEYPVTWSDAHLGGFWVVSRYADVAAVAQDHRRFLSSAGVGIPPLGNDDPLIPIETDPPDHRLYRGVINDLFTKKAVSTLEGVVRHATRALIDRVVTEHPHGCEVVGAFAYEQPMLVMWAEPFLGRPLALPGRDGRATARRFQEWVRDFKHEPERTHEAATTIRSYLADVLRDRQQRPADDIPTRLLTTMIRGRGMTFDECLGFLFLLFTAGTATTGDVLSATLLHLATHDDSLSRLREPAADFPTACEEFIRHGGPAQAERRTAAEDVELNGATIRAGAPVQLLWNSANRDERVFPDPDRVVLDRAPNPHLGFGTGVHRCIGAHLARLQVRVALEEWVGAVPAFRLQPGSSIRWSVGLDRSLRALRLEW